MHKHSSSNYIIFFSLLLMIFSCGKKESITPMFKVLQSDVTGIEFANNLHPDESFNMFHYMYYYNGAGVGAGDFNNDGKIDLFFASNESESKMYLNRGAMKFEDVTAKTGIVFDTAWNTGVSVVDINNDGLLDIYVCRLGDYEKFKSRNQFLICTGIKDGIPQYENKAKELGVDFSGFSTQAAFLDYDMDGDLDLFLLNHSVHQNGTFAPRTQFMGTYHDKSGDRLFENVEGKFIDKTHESKINSTAISYGLGVVVSDIDLDGWPDIYAGNDFHENDYLYINQKNKTFVDQSADRMMHTSQYTMGVDAADLTNDGLPEIISMDMLPKDPYILKRSLGEDDYDIFKYKTSVGYSHQYTRNNLQWNRGNGQFSETGMYSGMFATDWSWATLAMDFDNDGIKDIFVANGIPKRMNDIDYVSFVSNDQYQAKIRDNKMSQKDMALIDKFPEIKIPNQFFQNKKDLRFDDVTTLIEGNPYTYSNGAVYADLDNDGDLDIVVNNVNDKSFIYENQSAKKDSIESVSISFKGSDQNINALGTKLIIFSKDQIRTYEKYPVKGFLSSMEVPMLIGTKGLHVDSAFVVWPDNSYQKLADADFRKKTLQLQYKKGLPLFNYQIITSYSSLHTDAMEDATAALGLNFRHTENVFQEFNREQLIPHMNSTEGPALCVADINGDGLEDFFIGGAREQAGKMYVQEKNGKFKEIEQPAFEQDKNLEDVDAIFCDVNKDGLKDLVVATGGNEYFGGDPSELSRVYQNMGNAQFTRVENAIPIYTVASSVNAMDVNADGYEDLLITSRVKPFNYGDDVSHFVLINQKNAKFADMTSTYAPEWLKYKMVTNASLIDLNKDGKAELVMTEEWGGISAWELKGGKFIKQSVTDMPGWWTFVMPIDIDHDGDLDLVAGNLGMNNRLAKATVKQPVSLYYNDFDNNDRKEQVMTYFLDNKEISFANKDEIQRQIPLVKKKFLYAGDFAKAELKDIYGEDKLNDAKVSKAYYFSNSVLINEGNFKFTLKALPWECQLTTYKTAIAMDANHDGIEDILLMGNYYDNNIQMSRYDADFGTILINDGKGNLQPELINGLTLKGQVRRSKTIAVQGIPHFLLGFNSDSLRAIRFRK